MEAREALGFEQSTVAIENSLSLKQLNELETGACSVFYSESIQYAAGIKLLRKLGVPFDHLEIAEEPQPSSAEESEQLAAQKDAPFQESAEPVAATGKGFGYDSSKSAGWILALLALLIGLAFWLFPVEAAPSAPAKPVDFVGLMPTQNTDVNAYCHAKTTVKFAFDRSNSNNDVTLVVNGKSQKAITAYSWFGSVQAPPKGFKFAILGKGDFDPLLVFDGYLLDAKKRKYTQCN